MAAKRNREAVEHIYPPDGARPWAGEATESWQGGLRQQLRRSHLYIALLGLGLLLMVLATGLWGRSHTLRLVHLHGPTARISTLALNGIERSFAALRGWMLLGEPGFKSARAQAWNEVVWPALSELEVLSRDWAQAANHRRLAELRRILDALHGVQWWIEDVAQTPGNWPAREIADQVSRPVGDAVFDAITAVLDIEMEQALAKQSVLPVSDRATAASSGFMELDMAPEQAVERQLLVQWMIDLSHAFPRVRTAFQHLVDHSRGADATGYRTALSAAKSHLAKLQQNEYLLYQPQREQLTRVQHGLRTYEVFADEALALLQTGPRNVANDLLASEAMPLGGQASALLQAMSTSQADPMRQEASFVTLISNLTLGISLVLIAAMIAVASVLARRSTERIIQPVTALLHATQQLAAGTLTEDIPVRSHDELGLLTASFNTMRTSLHRTRELDDRNHFIRETFGRYVSDEVATRVLDDPSGLRFGGETRQVTMLMADLRGFTALAERLTPDQALAFLNRYLEKMVDIIMAHDGTINEILGDGIFVLFGAPIQRQDDARRAVACAVAMQLAINEMNAQHDREGLPEMDMGIAIHTGEVVVGNIGSQKRTKYAAVGSNVNLVGRIESYTIGGQILISEDTRCEVVALLHINGHMQIEPKGVSAPLTVYDVRGIDSPYNLYLPEPADTLVTLDAAIALRYTVLEEKFVGRTVFPGQFVKLSAKGGQIDASWPAPPLSISRYGS